AGGETLGFFAVGAESARRYDEEALRLAALIADRASAAIQNSRLYEEERRARVEAEKAEQDLASLTEALDRALAEVDLLNAITTAASGEEDLGRILERALEHLRRVIRFTGGSIALVESDDLVIRAAVGPFAEVALGQRLARGRGLSWRVIDMGEPFMSGDLLAEGRRPTTPVRSYLAVPLIWQGRPFGLLEVDSTETYAFTDADRVLMQKVAAALSRPIELAQRYAAEVRAVAEAEAAQWRLKFLAEASSLLVASLDLETTLANVAQLAVPEFADWCAVDLAGEDGTFRRAAVAHVDPAKVRWARALQERYPPDPHATRGIPHVLRTGRPEMYTDIPDSLLAAVARDEEHLRILREVGVTSAMIVPMVARDRTLGALTFVAAESGRRFDTDDLALAEELARRAALAVDNARLFQAEHRARAGAEEAVRRVNAVNRLIAIAASSLDLGGVFEELGDVLRSVVPFTRVTVSLYVPEKDWLTMPYFVGPELGVGPHRLEGPKAGTVRGWVLDHGRPFIRHDTKDADQFAEDRLLASAGVRSYVVVPMTVGGRAIGTLNLGHREPGVYAEEHVRVLQPIADQMAVTVSRFQLFEQTERRAGELSETLQRALLPSRLPSPPFAAIGAVYRPADPEAKIGGDWYDAFLLPEGTVMANIGDVTGHGLAAAAAMGQIRHVVRAYALEGRGPAEILAVVNQFICRLDGFQASMWIAVLDTISGELTYSGAGHPPVLALTGDESRFLKGGGPPLGIAPGTRYPDVHSTLSPGTRLIACTDGLLEVTRDIVEGQRRLMESALSTRHEPVDHAVETIIDQILGGTQPDDDVVLMMLDLLPLDAPLLLRLPAVPENLRLLRRALRTYVGRTGVPRERIEDVVVATGEAALNVVEHAYRGRQGDVVLHGRKDGDILTITVSDSGRWRPVLERGRGRGTRIMKEFADRVRTVTGPGGSVVELTWSVERLALPPS
ncbi:MAG: GAF domain-containing protein, partial [Armatimonadetes bacterium]|nr:GAF domain-containing protein [Armatimonadota bacterium]